ncbi:MAG: lipopolysaccharide transport periplasmic protein LptA [Pseudomonadota bacterium]
MNRVTSALLMLSLMAVATVADALEGDARAPVKVSAERADFDQSRGSAIYTGDVVLQQGSIEIRARKMEIFATEGRLDRAEVFGGESGDERALFRQQTDAGETIDGRAARIDIDQQSGLILLRGKARLDDGNSVINGPTIRYNSRQQTVQAEGDDDGERIEMIFSPADNAEE